MAAQESHYSNIMCMLIALRHYGIPIIKNPVRLGVENAGNRPRLLRIEVQTEEMKYKILKNASKLNEGKDWSDPTRRYVNMDYTAKERQINKELREQLKALKVSEPHKRHMIKGGKIVSEVVKKD